MKKKYVERTDYLITVEKVIPGTTCYNFLEDATYVADEVLNIKVIGIVGEEYLIDEGYLHKKYIVPGELRVGISMNVSPRKSQNFVWCEEVSGSRVVSTESGHVLKADKGDMQVWVDEDGTPSEDKTWFVSKEVFSVLYLEA